MPAERRQEEHTESGTLRFAVDAGLLFQLGEQLVTRRSIALAELIKNAYDADATHVTVRLEQVSQPGGTIVVADNGTGMTLDDITENWMRIATDAKLRNPVSTIYCRPRTGAKGIGRFAARRLADRLVLNSVAKADQRGKERVIAEFDWKRRFRTGQTLTRIPVKYDRVVVPDTTPTGVTLRLEGARDTWDESDVIELQKDVLTLANPFPSDALRPASTGDCEPDPGCSIELEVPEFPKYEGELGEQFLATAWGTLTGCVDEAGMAHYHLRVREPERDMDFVASEQMFDGLAEAMFTIRLFIYKSDYFKGLDFTLRDAQRMGREYGGVRIYLDGFRVFPFGDPTDDWLRLNEVRAGRTRKLVVPTEELRELEDLVPGRPYLLIPGNNQVFGAVSISRLKHPGIEISVSRERLVENEAFDKLRRFVQLGIYWMTTHYARLKAEEDTKRKEASRPSVLEIIHEAKARVEASAELSAESRSEILQTLDYARRTALVEEEERMSELSVLRVLSSTGAAVAVINHQLRAVVDGVRAIHTELSDLVPHLPSPAQERLSNIVTEVHDWLDIVATQLQPLGVLLGEDARVRRRRLVLREVVDTVTGPLSLYMRDFGISLSNLVPKHIRTPPVFEAELYAVLLHAFTNSLKAVREEEVREIAVNAEKHNGQLRIYVLDTGVGIDVDSREEAFKPFFTTSSPDPILGVGTGLGLTVMLNILETYGGTARFIDAQEPWNTCIEIVLPEKR